MKPHAYRIALHTAKAIVVLAPLSVAITVFSGAAAQENALGPPDVLQYPVQAADTAALGLQGLVLRAAIETEANLALCQALMTRAGRSIPADFSDADCPSEFKDKVSNNEGIVHWADNARPLHCGSSCFGRPFMSHTGFIDKPNLRKAMLYGRLNFVIDPPVPTNRDLTYFYEAHFTCKTVNGARNGSFVVDIQFGEPVIGDPGVFESVVDFLLLPVKLSSRIEARIRKHLSQVPGQTNTVNPCRSVGVKLDIDPLHDAAVYDLPQSAGPARRDNATIRFLRIIRKPLPALVDPSHAAPGNPAAGYFNVFLNGAAAGFPPKTPTPGGGIDLPPGGGIVELNYCRTIDLTGRDRLQLIFTNALGGAVWSQFARTDTFGANATKTMTTGRTIVVPGSSGPPDPVTGSSTPGKPHSMILQEFELVYTISYSPLSGTVATTEPARPGGRPDLGAVTGALEADPSAPEPQPCRKI